MYYFRRKAYDSAIIYFKDVLDQVREHADGARRRRCGWSRRTRRSSTRTTPRSMCAQLRAALPERPRRRASVCQGVPMRRRGEAGLGPTAPSSRSRRQTADALTRADRAPRGELRSPAQRPSAGRRRRVRRAVSRSPRLHSRGRPAAQGRAGRGDRGAAVGDDAAARRRRSALRGRARSKSTGAGYLTRLTHWRTLAGRWPRRSCSGSSAPTSLRLVRQVARAGANRRSSRRSSCCSGRATRPNLAAMPGAPQSAGDAAHRHLVDRDSRARAGRASRFEGSCRTPSPRSSRPSGCTDRGLHAQASHQRRLRNAPRARTEEDPADRRRDQRAVRSAARRLRGGAARPDGEVPRASFASGPASSRRASPTLKEQKRAASDPAERERIDAELSGADGRGGAEGELREEIADVLDEILPEAFATVREGARRLARHDGRWSPATS